jgi:glycosyltransferase involved in cell wall biosynthesis
MEIEKISLTWEGEQTENHSFAKVNQNIYKCLLTEGKLHLHTAPPANAQQPTTMIPGQKVNDPPPSDITIRHQWPPNWATANSKYCVCMQPWEYGALPRQWMIPMKYWTDQIWVYSTYNRECYIRCGLPEHKIKVVPLGVDETIYHPEVKPLPVQEPDRFRFLFVGGTIARKGIDQLLKAYLREFSSEEKVSLIIKDFGTRSFYQGSTCTEEIHTIMSHPHHPRIIYFDQDLPEEGLARLYKSCHCLVHPYRGEGFALPIIEAMACGVPAIVPNLGPSRDFCDEETTFFIPAEEEMLEQTQIADLDTVGKPWWLKIDTTDLQKRMRFVYENRSLVQEKGKKASAKIRSTFTWKKTAERVTELVTQLTQQEPPRKASEREILNIELKTGMLLYYQGHYQKAMERFLHLLTVYPHSWETHYHIALVDIATKESASAIRHLTYASHHVDTSSPADQAQIWHMLAIAYAQMQDFHQAIKALQKSATLNPSLCSHGIPILKEGIQKTAKLLSDLYLELGDCYRTNHNDFQAKEAYQRALPFVKNSPTLLQSLQQVEQRIEETKKQVIQVQLPEEKRETSDEQEEERATYDILWQSPLLNASGYAEEQRHFLESIQPYPLRVKVTPTDPPPPTEIYSSNLNQYLLSLQRKRFQTPLIHYQAAPAYYFSFPMAPLSIGRTMFETDSVPENWVKILNEMTEIWVPSEFNRETFAAAGIPWNRLQIIPGTLDENIFNPAHATPYTLTDTASFKFLSVFDWSIRKGWDILLQAYFEEFDANDDVSLILKLTYINEPNIDPYKKIRELAKKLGIHKPSPVHIIHQHLAEKELVGLYKAVDCFVLPSRGEGWGRPYMAAMAMELPTIGTKWSAPLTFMNDHNSYLIEMEGLVPVDLTGMPAHFKGHRWAEPSVDHLKALLRQVYTHQAAAKQKGKQARKDLFPRFAKSTIGRQIFERVHELVRFHYL